MPTFHLVVDEVVPVDKHQFRVRMWRQADFPPLVLLSQVPGHPPPDWCSSLLGNLVLRSFLGYSLPIPVFFELSRWDGEPGRSGSATRPSAVTSVRSCQAQATPAETRSRRAALRSQARHPQLKGAP